MIDILHELHCKYLPLEKHVIDGEEVVTILERLFFGGDQLTGERASNCKDARSDGDSKFERLKGLFSKVEVRHAVRLLYQVCYNKLLNVSTRVLLQAAAPALFLFLFGKINCPCCYFIMLIF